MFRFEYRRVLRKPLGVWAPAEWRFFGLLHSGEVSLGDLVLAPTLQGSVGVYVVRFMEEFDEWLGLPFYNTLNHETAAFAFCICVDATPFLHTPVVSPGHLSPAETVC